MSSRALPRSVALHARAAGRALRLAGAAALLLGGAADARAAAERAERGAALAQADLLDWAGGMLRRLGGGTQEAGAPALPDAAELARRRELADAWDAFLTFVVKEAGHETLEPELRRELLAVLLDGRHDVVSMLSDATRAVADPLRTLFDAGWQRLAPALERLAGALPADQAARYRAFLEGGDALRALGELGAAAGLELSPDELRRLARLVAPAPDGDPLYYDAALDPALRELFGFGPPLDAPAENPEVEASSLESAPDGDEPPPGDAAPPGAGRPLAPRAWFGLDPARGLVGAAWAEDGAPPGAAALDPYGALVERLNAWVPRHDEIEAYLPVARDLLRATAQRTLAARPIEAPHDGVFRHLVLATAWQETCWRQFVRVEGTTRPIRSPSGSVGLMQINHRVWRGFYDLPGLQRDIGYNGRAGSEILRHYLVDYAIRKGEHQARGQADDLARATYAVYNGGPRHLRRYRTPTTSPSLRAIDELFWEKYRAVKAGRELDVIRCYTGK